MQSKMNCPACGAEIQILENEDRVRCEFCGTELRASREDGETTLEVLSQPEPQTSEMIAANRQLGEGLGDLPEGEQVAPGYATSGTGQADPGALSFPAVPPEVPFPANSIPESPPYQAGRQQVGTVGTNTTTRWILISVAIFVLVCVLCACVAGVILIANGVIIA